MVRNVLRSFISCRAKILSKNDDKVWWRAGWHQMGTCRMGHDPNKSVVNGWGRSHDVKNLFIVDGSIFVTAGAVNPTSTIQALALYIGDQIKKTLAHYLIENDMKFPTKMYINGKLTSSSINKPVFNPATEKKGC